MMVAIAMRVGIYDLGSLLMIFSLVALMNLMGLAMEIHNQTTQKTNWTSFIIVVLQELSLGWWGFSSGRQAIWLWLGKSLWEFSGHKRKKRPSTFAFQCQLAKNSLPLYSNFLRRSPKAG